MKTSAIAVLLVCVATFALATLVSLRPAPVSLDGGGKKHAKTRFLTREGYALSVSYQHDWNIHDHLDLHEIPTLLQTSMLYAEDLRFFDHGGIDWTARLHALVQNVAALRPVRGASTITEQTVRLLYPRPRTLWSRWLEGFEARRLERRFSKSEILAFYLNQVPYSANRRGVAQAARYFFDRSVDTLSLNEMLALAVMIRAPSRFNLWRNPDGVRSRVNVLAARLERDGVINDRQLAHVRASTVTLAKSSLQVQATHFAHYVSETRDLPTETSVNTTLDAALQTSVQALLDQRLAGLKHKRVNNGAVLVVDHRDNVILAWCIGKPFADTPSSKIDAVRARRQPGSTLKPFLYAMALEHGWSAATIIDVRPWQNRWGPGCIATTTTPDVTMVRSPCVRHWLIL